VKRAPRGFSIIELVVAMAVTTTCAAAMLSLVSAGQSIARAQPEAADQQQRARIAIQTLGSELARAGAGLDRGARAGPLVQYFTPVERSADGGLTLWYVSDASTQATLGAPFDPGAIEAAIDSAGSCPAAEPACAFAPATSAILFDSGGCRDVLRIDDVAAGTIVTRPAARNCAYPAGSSVARGEVRTYRVDPVSRQLLRRDEATGTSLPVLDEIAGMTIDILDAGRRVRISLRVASTLFQVPELAIALDVAPPNLRERW
jgi:prepilin-type N-terminal cleavage/methylation domain-containing protein